MPSSAPYERAATEEPNGVHQYPIDDEDHLALMEGESGGTVPLSKQDRKRIWWRNATVNAFFIGAWFIFATLLSVYNKWMFSKEHFGFSWPLFVTTFHMLVQWALAAVVRALWPRTFRPENKPSWGDYGRKVAPTAIATSMDIGMSNLSLKAITLSFYTMCKSSSLIFVLFFAFLFRLEAYSLRLIGVILLIFVGVLMMVASETHFVLSGFILVISASAMGGLRWSLTQILLKNKGMGMDNPAATIYWLAPAMGLSLAVVSMIVENWATVLSSKFFDGVHHILETCFFLVAPGILAFCMVLSEFYILQRAGVVPMSIAGIAKEVTTISISAWLFGDDLTPLNIVGVAITICGIALFTYHKYRKSVDSAEILDALDDARTKDFANDGLQVELDVRARGGVADAPSGPQHQLSASDSQILFAVDDGEEDDGGHANMEPPRDRRPFGEEIASTEQLLPHS